MTACIRSVQIPAPPAPPAPPFPVFSGAQGRSRTFTRTTRVALLDTSGLAGSHFKTGALSHSAESWNQYSSDTGYAYAYDAEGNLIEKVSIRDEHYDHTVYTWDSRNRLTKVEFYDGNFTSCTNDDGGRKGVRISDPFSIPV